MISGHGRKQGGSEEGCDRQEVVGRLSTPAVPRETAVGRLQRGQQLQVSFHLGHNFVLAGDGGTAPEAACFGRWLVTRLKERGRRMMKSASSPRSSSEVEGGGEKRRRKKVEGGRREEKEEKGIEEGRGGRGGASSARKRSRQATTPRTREASCCVPPRVPWNIARAAGVSGSSEFLR